MAHVRFVWILPVVLFAFMGGCGTGQPTASESGRPQRMVTTDLTGIWISPPSDTVNDWQVALLPDGSMTVSGPGLRARGHYWPTATGANVTYIERNGVSPEAEARHVQIAIDSNANQLIFPTGIPGDEGVPLRLIRADRTSQ